ncbi:hypothetical protein Tco_1373967 [Tanacetum coccineum]
MTIQKIVIHVNKPQPLLDQQHSNNSTRFAEVAGGTTAECAAVCCCFPIGLVNLLVLAVYGVPAGLYRKALKRKRQRKMLKKGGGGDDVDGDRSSCDGEELLIGERVFSYGVVTSLEVDSDVMRFEDEMWGKFYGTGFWRSASQRVD